MQRKLAAILSADVVGYSHMMEGDEVGTLDRLKANRRDIFDPKVAEHGGRIVKLMGDGALVEFPSVVSAVTCAIEVQEAIENPPAGAPEARIRYRIGVNLGDVIVEGDDLYGEGVNVAARLQTLADPGCVALSRTVRDHIAGKVPHEFDDIGEHVVKQNERPVHVFLLRCGRRAPRAPANAAARGQSVSVCVLPFLNISGDPEQEYFSDGVTEDIITDLSKIKSLAVVSRNTAFTFKGKATAVSQVARQLNVSHVLEGSVRKAGNRVRITAQLIEGATDSHLWAERYDRDLHDIFAVQDEISEAIVRALKLKLMPAEKKAIEARSTSNPEAYKFYLMARSFHLMGQGKHRPIIIRLCLKAVELDPAYARAWALLATCQSNIRLLAGGSGDNGWSAAEKALALDPNLAEAHAARGRILADAGKYDDAWREHEIALTLDPDSFDVNTAVARCALATQQNARAIDVLEKAASVNETDVWALGMAIQAYEAKGDMEGMKSAARRCLERVERIIAAEPDHTLALSFGVTALAALGELERAREWTERAMIIEPEELNLTYNLACSMVTLGDFDLALKLLAPNCATAQVQSLHWFRVDSSLDPIRGDPRFQKLMGDMARRFNEPLKPNEL